MTAPDLALRLMAYSRASLLLSLEGLTDADLRWQPAPGRNPIGHHACHVAHYRVMLLWFFQEEPDFDPLGPTLAFGYGANPDELLAQIPTKSELYAQLHQDWQEFLARYRQFRAEDFDRPLPCHNPDGETLLESCHRTAWHSDHHVGKICALRTQLGKPIFPRPAFGTLARRRINRRSESGWEQILQAIDPEMRLPEAGA